MNELQYETIEPPQSKLLSHTSTIRERHGELAATVNSLQIVSCDDLNRISTRVMSQYFSTEKTSIPVREPVRHLAKSIARAATATLQHIQDETVPLVSPDHFFDGLELKLCDPEQKRIDETIRGVLGRIGIGGYFDHGVDNRTYLFRIDTGYPELNMVTELHRTRMPDFHPVTGRQHVDVFYHLSIAGYDADSNSQL